MASIWNSLLDLWKFLEHLNHLFADKVDHVILSPEVQQSKSRFIQNIFFEVAVPFYFHIKLQSCPLKCISCHVRGPHKMFLRLATAHRPHFENPRTKLWRSSFRLNCPKYHVLVIKRKTLPERKNNHQWFFFCDKFTKTNDGWNRLHSKLNYRRIIASSLGWFSKWGCCIHNEISRKRCAIHLVALRERSKSRLELKLRCGSWFPLKWTSKSCLLPCVGT